MKKAFSSGMVACAFGLMVCKPETIEPSPQHIWPKPMNHTGYVVEKITWYESETNHSEATYEYDDNPRPNFNTDNIFMYYPMFGLGETYFPVHVSMLSQNNMTRSSEGQVTWEYEYNENGLPQSVYYQLGDVVPYYHTTLPIYLPSSGIIRQL